MLFNHFRLSRTFKTSTHMFRFFWPASPHVGYFYTRLDAPWSVCQSVCVLVTAASPAKAAELIEVQFGDRLARAQWAIIRWRCTVAPPGVYDCARSGDADCRYHCCSNLSFCRVKDTTCQRRRIATTTALITDRVLATPTRVNNLFNNWFNLAARERAAWVTDLVMHSGPDPNSNPTLNSYPWH